MLSKINLYVVKKADTKPFGCFVTNQEAEKCKAYLVERYSEFPGTFTINKIPCIVEQIDASTSLYYVPSSAIKVEASFESFLTSHFLKSAIAKLSIEEKQAILANQALALQLLDTKE